MRNWRRLVREGPEYPRTILRLALIALGTAVIMSAASTHAQVLHRKKGTKKAASVDNSAAPDKVLYDRAMDDIKHGRHEIGRLSMQTLINTYPDSEYLAKAKLAIADSYYKEGGTANMTQAIQAYKDFIVFFPFLPEAAYAQLQVAMAHYRQMEKPDRDRSQAKDAEEEFQTFLTKYPNDPLAPKAEQRLREVQEVLAEGDYRIGYFYYVKGDRRAAAGRLLIVTNRYPLYSRSDRALWMLGDIFEKSERKDIAGRYYARIVRDYPLSDLVPDAKSRLKELKQPIPPADPKAVAWMRAEQNAPRQHTSLIGRPMELFHPGPKGEIQAAARYGTPNMSPEDESSGEVLGGGGQQRLGGTGNSIVATVAPGNGASAASAPAVSSAESTSSAAEGTPATDSNAPKDAPAASPADNPAANAPASAAQTDPANPGASASSPAANPPDGTATAADPPKDPAKTDGSQTDAQDKANGDDAKASGKADPKKESSSKKKKGLRKIVPW